MSRYDTSPRSVGRWPGPPVTLFVIMLPLAGACAGGPVPSRALTKGDAEAAFVESAVQVARLRMAPWRPDASWPGAAALDEAHQRFVRAAYDHPKVVYAEAARADGLSIADLWARTWARLELSWSRVGNPRTLRSVRRGNRGGSASSVAMNLSAPDFEAALLRLVQAFEAWSLSWPDAGAFADQEAPIWRQPRTEALPVVGFMPMYQREFQNVLEHAFTSMPHQLMIAAFSERPEGCNELQLANPYLPLGGTSLIEQRLARWSDNMIRRASPGTGELSWQAEIVLPNAPEVGTNEPALGTPLSVIVNGSTAPESSMQLRFSVQASSADAPEWLVLTLPGEGTMRRRCVRVDQPYPVSAQWIKRARNQMESLWP